MTSRVLLSMTETIRETRRAHGDVIRALCRRTGGFHVFTFNELEATERWRPDLAPLIAKYPYRIDCFALDPECQTMLLSKLPIVRPIAGRVWKATPIVAGGEILWNGRPITVLATHWFRPLARSDESQWGADDPARSAYLAAGLPVTRQAGQAGLIAKFLNRQPRDLILMGDFNSVPWSRVLSAFRARTATFPSRGSSTRYSCSKSAAVFGSSQ